MTAVPPVVRGALTHQRRRYAELLDLFQNRDEQLTRHRHLGHLKSDVLGMPNHLCSDLDQLLPQRGQRPVLGEESRCKS